MTTTIQLEDDTWKILSHMKIDRGFKTYDELISSLLKEEDKHEDNNESNQGPSNL